MRSITITENSSDATYMYRATYKRVGMVDIISIDWEHPNYGYFADAMFWYRSMHMSDWEPISIVSWSERYKSVDKFVEDFPKFAPLFSVEDVAQDTFHKIFHS